MTEQQSDYARAAAEWRRLQKHLLVMCDECELHSNENNAHRLDDLRIAPDGRYLCELCWDSADEYGNEPPRWNTLPPIANAPVAELLERAEAQEGELVLRVEADEQRQALLVKARNKLDAVRYSLRLSEAQRDTAQAEIARLRQMHSADDVLRAETAELRDEAYRLCYQRGRDDLRRQLGMDDVPDDKVVAHLGDVLDAAHQRGRVDAAQEIVAIIDHECHTLVNPWMIDRSLAMQVIRERYGLASAASDEKL